MAKENVVDDEAFVTCNGMYTYLDGLRPLFPESGELIPEREAQLVEKRTDADVCYGGGSYYVYPRSENIELFEVKSKVEFGPDSDDMPSIIEETKKRLKKNSVTLIFH